MTTRRRLWLALSLAVVAGVAHADPSPPHIDFARYFFASPEVECEKRSEVWDVVRRLQGLRGKVGSSASALLAALETNDEVQRRLYRHVSYLHLRSSIDTRDEASRQDEARLAADVDAATAFLGPELQALSDESLERWLKETPALVPYRFALVRARRSGGHAPDAPTSALLASLEPEIAGWQSELHQRLLDQLRLDPIVVNGRSLDPLRDRRALAGNPDAAVRERAFRTRYAGLAAQEDLHAFALLKLANALDRMAVARGFADAPSAHCNYVYGGILGLEYYRRLRADPAFASSFVSLLKQGFDDTPQNLLVHGIGLDLRDPRLAASSFAVLRGKLDEYRAATR